MRRKERKLRQAEALQSYFGVRWLDTAFFFFFWTKKKRQRRLTLPAAGVQTSNARHYSRNPLDGGRPDAMPVEPGIGGTGDGGEAWP